MATARAKVEMSRLLSAAKTKDEMEGRLLLDVVVGQSATIFQLLSGEDQTLLIGRDSYRREGNQGDSK